MKTTLKLFAAAIAIAVAGGASAQDITIATEGAYPPFNEKNAAGELIGFDVDIAKALCEEMKKECVIVAQDWDGIIPGLVNKKYDAIIASMSITEERLKSIDFAGPYYSNYLAIIAPKGEAVTTGDLKSIPAGAQRSTVASEWLENTVGSRGDVKLYDTQTAAYADLTAGRIEALASDFLPAAAWVAENDGFAISEKIDIDDKIGIGVRKGEDALKADFDKALAAIRANGKYLEIANKYFGTDIF